VESRKKRIHSGNTQNTSLSTDEQLVPVQVTSPYNQMTVKELRNEIKLKNLQVKGLAKLKKAELLSILHSI
jgi:hypothetical protein